MAPVRREGLDTRRHVSDRCEQGAMDLLHREPPSLKPTPVQRAELRVPIAVVGVLGEVLDVQQRERHARPTILAMDRLEVGQRVLALGLDALAEHALLELAIIERVDVREPEPRRARAVEHLPHHAHAAPDAGGDLSLVRCGLQLWRRISRMRCMGSLGVAIAPPSGGRSTCGFFSLHLASDEAPRPIARAGPHARGAIFRSAGKDMVLPSNPSSTS